eukprot:3575418-Pleurochrysis_carterae.AAC.2
MRGPMRQVASSIAMYAHQGPSSCLGDRALVHSHKERATGDWFQLRKIQAYQCFRTDPHTLTAPRRARDGSLQSLVRAHRFVDDMQKLIPNGPPSLINCKKLAIVGKVVLGKGVVFEGTVKVTNASDEWKTLATGTYKDGSVIEL